MRPSPSLEIHLFGPQTPKYNYLRDKLDMICSFQGLDVAFIEHHTLMDIVDNKLLSVPAVRINGNVFSMNAEIDIHTLVKKVYHEITKYVNPKSLKRLNLITDPYLENSEFFVAIRKFIGELPIIIDALHLPSTEPETQWIQKEVLAWEKNFIGDYHDNSIIRPIKFSKGSCKNVENPCDGCKCSLPLHYAAINVVHKSTLDKLSTQTDNPVLVQLTDPRTTLIMVDGLKMKMPNDMEIHSLSTFIHHPLQLVASK